MPPAWLRGAGFQSRVPGSGWVFGSGFESGWVFGSGGWARRVDREWQPEGWSSRLLGREVWQGR
jgi:hypothetical protein